ncbi:MAG TPA: lipid II flippase MurJ, partial [Gemmatimonadaceae bacterium]|nr:lipid II flippase MurJ [Gemmatimonadaceae bacterium]
MKAVRDSLALTLILGFATLVSFVNQLAIARAFGAGPSMDLYLQAVAIPLFAMATFSGLFAFAMVPVLTRARAQAQGASVLAGHFLRAFAVMSLTVGMLGWLLAPLQLRMLGVGRLAPESVNTAIVIARFAWGAVALSLVTGFLASVGNAARRFSVPGFATLLPILGVLIACVGWAGTFGVQVLAVGLLAGYACAALALFAALRNEIVWPPAKSAVGEVSAFFGKVPLALIAVFSLSIYPAIDAFWAPRLGAANLSYLGYCQRL